MDAMQDASSCPGRFRQARGHGAALSVLLLACLAAPAATAANFGFEDAGNDGAPAGWSVRGDGYEIAVDRSIVLEGTGSLRISSRASGGSAARVSQHVPPPRLDGNRLRVTARIRTDAVDGSAGLWLRIDSGKGLLYVDGMREG